MRRQINQENEAFLAFVEGNESGFDFFFNCYYSSLIFYSSKITNNREAARDIVSEAFIKLWNNKDRFAESSKIKFFLYRVVYNASIDYLRKEKIEAKVISRLGSGEDFIPNALEKFIELETHHRLYLLLSKLPFKCRQVFQMFYFQDKAVKEIAVELGISVNTVKSQKQRAIQLLKESRLLIQLWSVICLLFVAV